jgi:molybdate transport repressor ModE-like protein
LHHRCAEMLDQGSAIDWDDFRFVLAIVRGGSVSAAAKQLGVDHATVIRRVDRLEHHLSAKLFDRRKTGYLLTQAGQRVADSAEAMESTIAANQEAVGGSRAHLTGTVRIGAPDGFGSHFLASRLVKFGERYPELDLQLVATARLFSLSKREADIAISLSMPKEGRIVGRKLLDYTLGLYATADYLDRTPRISSRVDLPQHRFVGYIEELLFTPELDYLPQISQKIAAKFRSANLIAQLNATLSGFGIAVLPHFMASAHPELLPVLPQDVSISRTFWLLMHADSKDLARIRAVANYIYETVESERALFNRA